MTNPVDRSNRGYRRGAVMGLTLAEAFILITFAVLMLLALWRLQVNHELSRFDGLEGLSVPELNTVRRLVRSGQLETVDQIIAGGGNLEHVVEQLAELGEARLTPSEVAAAITLANSDQLEAASSLVTEGLDLAAGAGLDDQIERWRLIDRDEILRMVDAVADMPDDVQSDLADLVEIDNPRYLAMIIRETQRAIDGAPETDPLARVGEIFDQASLRRAQTVELLRDRLGAQISQLEGATIRDDGTIVLPETVAFGLGLFDLHPEMQAYLSDICEPWLLTLVESQAPISGATIEGHTDSSWTNAGPEQAFLNNLGLSQQRSAAVLRYCLGEISDEAVRDWAKQHLVSIAYSSARLILDEHGEEDPDASRRVELSIQFDESEVLRQIADLGDNDVTRLREFEAALSQGSATISGTVTDVRDGDTFVVKVADLGGREFPIRLGGVNCEENGSALGDRATDFLNEVLRQQDVTCQLDGGRTGDRYAGRCETPGLGDIGQAVILRSYCSRCDAFDGEGFYLEAQATAGPWEGSFPSYCVAD